MSKLVRETKAPLVVVRSDVLAKAPKQAVIVVHGMGEQRPMETLRGFVDAVCDTVPVDGASNGPVKTWIIPDTRTGSAELSRITTEVNKSGYRTDFYELYWSDILTGNTLQQLTDWARGLLFRWPHQVPKETFSQWIALWVVCITIIALTGFGLTANASLEQIKTAWIASMQDIGKPLGLLPVLGAVIIWLGGTWYLSHRYRMSISSFEENLRRFFSMETMRSIRDASVGRWLSMLVLFALPALLAIMAYRFLPWGFFLTQNVAALLTAAILAWGIKTFVVPVFGDVARYLRAAPDAVAARGQIRERGLKLLRDIHSTPSLRTFDDYDLGDKIDYEKIIVVGHSLGSIVAYDLLRLFWAEKGPNKQNPPDETLVLPLLKDVDRYVADCLDSAQAKHFDTEMYRAKQGALSAALAQTGGWKIADLLTLGSPLTHAEFLLTRDAQAFALAKHERSLPTCPPTNGGNKSAASFLYQSGGTFADHSSMFAAMRWTNVYDPTKYTIFGDFISGPCSPNFGQGLVDVTVRKTRNGFLGRAITHTDYWNQNASAECEESSGQILGLPNIQHDKLAHIRIIQKTLGFI